MSRQSFPNRSFRRSGRTLLDVVIALALVMFLTAALLPAAVSSQEVANRIRCARNLKQIGMGLQLYANENNGNFPRTKYDWSDKAKVTAYTGFAAADPFAKDGGPEANDVTAVLYLLIRTQDLYPEAFVCPSTNAQPLDFGIKPARAAVPPARPSTSASRPATAPGALPELSPAIVKEIQLHSNFPDNRNLSYSVHNPYFNQKAIDSGARWTNTLNSSFPTVADMNPGGEAYKTLTAKSAAADQHKGNSANHGGDGQNVLFGDGHVQFEQTPFCGINEDNLYSFGPSGKDKGGDGIIGFAAGKDDAILLPTAADGKPVADGKK